MILFAAKDLGHVPGTVLDDDALARLRGSCFLNLEVEGFELVRMGASRYSRVRAWARVFRVQEQGGVE